MILVLVSLNVFGIREAVRLNVVLAIVDFSTQVLLVLIGASLIFHPHLLASNVHFGVAPEWSKFLLAIPIGMIAYTGMETISNLAEETRNPPRDVPRAYKFVAGAVFTIYSDATGNRLDGAARSSRSAITTRRCSGRTHRRVSRTTRYSGWWRTSAYTGCCCRG